MFYIVFCSLFGRPFYTEATNQGQSQLVPPGALPGLTSVLVLIGGC